MSKVLDKAKYGLANVGLWLGVFGAFGSCANTLLDVDHHITAENTPVEQPRLGMHIKCALSVVFDNESTRKAAVESCIKDSILEEREWRQNPPSLLMDVGKGVGLMVVFFGVAGVSVWKLIKYDKVRDEEDSLRPSV